MTEGKTTKSTGRIAWWRYLLVFFVAAWMFVLGVLVGRGTAPVHFDTQALQKELVVLRDAMLKKERESVEKAIRGEDQKAPLEFYEALKKDEPDTAVQIPVDPATTGGPSTRADPTDAIPPPHKLRFRYHGQKSHRTGETKRGDKSVTTAFAGSNSRQSDHSGGFPEGCDGRRANRCQSEEGRVSCLPDQNCHSRPRPLVQGSGGQLQGS